jgi:hypothetical protein
VLKELLFEIRVSDGYFTFVFIVHFVTIPTLMNNFIVNLNIFQFVYQ